MSTGQLAILLTPVAVWLAGCGGFGDPAEVETVLLDDRGEVVGELVVDPDEPSAIGVEARGLEPARAYEIAAVPGASCGEVFSGDDASMSRRPLGSARAGALGELSTSVSGTELRSEGTGRGTSVVVVPDGSVTDTASPVACGALRGDAYTRVPDGIRPRQGPVADPKSQQMFPDDVARPPAGGGDPPG